ncbi:coatomer subunit delta [Sitodiplosis mosellana]|uniref:coatomer subunit delta n=1 Tax=Sitodiplosis mosellana TaxID=263140 RepID=UPI002444C439|nr:coatomer subunit delta [Sitodiplosis mosellana]
MVLIAAAVFTKAGKVIISRQFIEMTKARIEGLLAAFPKLITSGKQHTFVESDSVRYVYQPMEKLYMVLITTKTSNILEDLETLRLFSKVIPEYCRNLDEKDISENAFNLIFAFDEIVALGYRESVNLGQIKTFVEMDSHEEKVYLAVRQTQEREAKQKMREKAKELQRQRLEASKRGVSLGRGGSSSSSSFGGGISSGGFGSISSSSSLSQPSVGIGETAPSPVKKPAPTRNALKLGGKSKDVDSFVDQLKSEGENVTNLAPTSHSAAPVARAKANVHTEDVHLRVEDKMNLRIGREGGLQLFELFGLLTLKVADEKYGKIKVQLENNVNKSIQLQTHPNVDKELFRSANQIGLKNSTKPFPINTDVGVLKWRYQTQDETAIPLTINCWPSQNPEGGCDVNIEYELEHQQLQLQDLSLSIPLPTGCQPTVVDCEGDYHYDKGKNRLQWNISIVDASNPAGSMEFSCPSSIPGDFFPVEVTFVSKVPYADLKVLHVTKVDDDSAVPFSVETIFYPEKYEIA